MQINTNLSVQDYLRGYKEMCRFIARSPVICGVMLLLALLVTVVPFSFFPLRMGACALLVSLVVCVVSIQYRYGSLRRLAAELNFHQRLILPAILGITALSWLAFFAADLLSGLMPAAAGNAAVAYDGMTLTGIVLGGALVCVAQLMPYILAHFCHSFSLSRKQGEHIWLSLMLRWKTLAAFLPVALFVPLAIVLKQDWSAFLLLAASMYCTFLMFIVFNISPEPEAQKVSLPAFMPQGA